MINLSVDLSDFRSVSSTMYISALNVLMVLDLPAKIPPPSLSTPILGPHPKTPSRAKKSKHLDETNKSGGLVFTISERTSSSDDFAAPAPYWGIVREVFPLPL
ncbi:unnamed protein product [Linum trigynum]|uniref:Uncharacterized protein n=1 Tax=Linum trigynum TaxID=586398 RepID=A0AAV2FEQ7_9ROSI